MAYKMGSSSRHDASFNARKPNKPLKFVEGMNRVGQINKIPLEEDTVAEEEKIDTTQDPNWVEIAA